MKQVIKGTARDKRSGTADLSRSVQLWRHPAAYSTLACEDNHKDRAGNRGTQFIPVEAFVSKTNPDNGIFERIHKGDLIEAISTIKNNNYTDAQGVMQYQTILFCENIKLLESKTVTDARLAGRATAANAATATPAPAEAAPAEAAPAEAQDRKSVV